MKDRLDNNFSVVMTMDEIKKEHGLTGDVGFIGYLIDLPKREEFVSFVKSEGESHLIGYADRIANAYIYDDHNKAIEDAKKISKYDVRVCTVLDTPDQILTHPLWTNY